MNTVSGISHSKTKWVQFRFKSQTAKYVENSGNYEMVLK